VGDDGQTGRVAKHRKHQRQADLIGGWVGQGHRHALKVGAFPARFNAPANRAPERSADMMLAGALCHGIEKPPSLVQIFNVF
jgi:hypothetical protein